MLGPSGTFLPQRRFTRASPIGRQYVPSQLQRALLVAANLAKVKNCKGVISPYTSYDLVLLDLFG